MCPCVMSLGVQMFFFITIAIFGGIAMVAAFCKMNKGFGPINLRVFGLVVITTFVMLLAIAVPESQNASLGIIGTIVGYLFGSQCDSRGEKTTTDQPK